MRELTCNCGHVAEYDLDDRYDLDADPQLEAQILDGTFLTVLCPSCGTPLKPEFPLRVVGREAGVDAMLLPESDRWAYVSGEQLDYEIDPQASRVVIGVPELIDKLRIARAQRDDRVVEVLKYYLLGRALDDAPDDAELRIYYDGEDDDRLRFRIVGLRPGEHAVSQVPVDLYERAAGDLTNKLSESPFAEFLAEPYVSIQRLMAGGTDK